MMAHEECNEIIQADESEVSENAELQDLPQGRPPSTPKLCQMDSLSLEAGNVSSVRSHGAKMSWVITMHLAFQSIGVVYGDLGTSPLYVYPSTFTEGIKDKDDILGVLSLIIYTLTIIPFTKYALIVLWANDDGNGGAFALYSLISRYAKISLLPNQQAEDAMLSNYKLETASTKTKRAEWIKEKLESSKAAKIALILLTILGASMIMGDGVLTPCVSVLSAVSGIKQKAEFMTEGEIAAISIVILIVLFFVQRFGIDKVGYTFAPILLVWCGLISGIGIYNLLKHNLGVLRALNPKHIVDYFNRNGKQAWISLRGVVLCITGSEAMFADLAHFNVRAIQISFTAVIFPSVLLAYVGQAAYLTKFPENVAYSFYKSIPGSLFWPTFITAIAASIIASQAVISCVFSIVAQAQTLGCFPRVKIVHTSAKYEGQVYIPELNFAMMTACVLVTGSFRTAEHLSNAYGLAVICDMIITTCFVTLVMLVIWEKSIWKVTLFFLVLGGTEFMYLSSVLTKFVSGGFIPLVFSVFLMQIMGVWHYANVKRYMFELENKIPGTYIRDLALRRDLKRVPGIGLLYSELVEGIPPIFAHFIEKIPSMHSVLIFISVKHLPVCTVEIRDRFLFRHVEPREYRIYRCVVRYGYKDAKDEPGEFESLLIENLKKFIHSECLFHGKLQANESKHLLEETASANSTDKTSNIGPCASPDSIQLDDDTRSFSNDNSIKSIEDEKQFIQYAMSNGVVYLLGETEVVARNKSSITKRIAINYFYNFMRRNCRQGRESMSIPRNKLLKVGMTYEL